MAHKFFSGHNPFSSSSSRGSSGSSSSSNNNNGGGGGGGGSAVDKRPRIQNIPEEEESLKSPTQANFGSSTFDNNPHNSAESERRPVADTAGAGAPSSPSAGSGNATDPSVFQGNNPVSSRLTHSPLQSSEGEPPRQQFTGNPFGDVASVGADANVSASSNTNRPRSADSDQAPDESAPGNPAGAATGSKTGNDNDDNEQQRQRQQQQQQQQQQSQHLFPPNYGLGRRTSVSAESLNPSTCAADNWTPPQHPKTPEQLSRLKKALSNIILFNNLDEDQMTTILEALVEKPVPAKGIKIIAQGDQGDFFYVIETGKFDVYKNESGYVQSGKDGLGTKVATLKEGEFFGELALMYNAPRSASVVSADQKSTVWALDRITFRRILLDSAFTRRRMYEAFLEEVPILSSLKPYERSKVADALRTVKYKPGETIITEGEPGNAFYLLESGTANAYKSGILDEDQPVMRYQRGDYFGELALLDDKPRRASIIAETNVTVAMLHRDGFMRLLGPVQNIMRRTSYDAGRPSTAEASGSGSGGASAGAGAGGNAPESTGTNASGSGSQQQAGSRHDGADDGRDVERKQGVQQQQQQQPADDVVPGATGSTVGIGSMNGKKRSRGSSDETNR
ncbi:hypothetical protein KEM54_000936 [Ascosphaera aggregata]|nr:hypothetical protein KEM54_000936 [Ascosphaera aggregata]